MIKIKIGIINKMFIFIMVKTCFDPGMPFFSSNNGCFNTASDDFSFVNCLIEWAWIEFNTGKGSMGKERIEGFINAYVHIKIDPSVIVKGI